MKILNSLSRKLRGHACHWGDLPKLPVVERPEDGGEHDFRLDMEHLESLVEAIFGEAGRYAARFPEQAESYFVMWETGGILMPYALFAEFDADMAEFAELLS